MGRPVEVTVTELAGRTPVSYRGSQYRSPGAEKPQVTSLGLLRYWVFVVLVRRLRNWE